MTVGQIPVGKEWISESLISHESISFSRTAAHRDDIDLKVALLDEMPQRLVNGLEKRKVSG